VIAILFGRNTAREAVEGEDELYQRREIVLLLNIEENIAK
jgi:hypothetical protein